MANSRRQTLNHPTLPPSGLSITRNGNIFTISWRIGDANYGGGQNLRYRTQKLSGSWREWTNVNVNATDTSKAITLNFNDFYPTNTSKILAGIQFEVRGKRQTTTEQGPDPLAPSSRILITTHEYSWSVWMPVTFSMTAPNKPTLTSAINASNQTTFSWSISNAANDTKPFTGYLYESMVVDESAVTNGASLNWSSSASGWRTGSGAIATGSLAITEDSYVTQSGSHTRWFRVRATGPAGGSDWTYLNRVFAIPYAAVVSSATVTNKTAGYLVDVIWSVTKNAAYPISETVVEYAKAVPAADMQIPSSPGWTEAGSTLDTTGKARASFNIDGLLAADQCLWVRVVTKYDNRSNYSAPYLARIGVCANPTNVSVSATGRNATVTATNNSSASVYTGSSTSVKRLFLAICYKGVKNYTGGYVIGIMPYGSSSLNVTLPDQTTETGYSIGARAMVATYSGTTISNTSMYSDLIWTENASVAKAPGNMALSYDGTKLHVSWTWSWADADAMELSWSDDRNAWSSTNTPQTYTINQKATTWSIADLPAGSTYYVRGRLIKDGVFGPYCDPVGIKLTVPPLKPVLRLSDGTITDIGKVTASWNYQSGDGTEQTYAEIRTKSGNTYSNPIAKVDSEKQVTLYAESLGWQRGATYLLVLRVCSASGSYSEYSDPVPIEIATIGQATITSDSLETVTVQDDESVTRQVTALTEMPLTMSVTGAGRKGMTEIAIERAEAFQIDRPDESTMNGFEGETIYLTSFIGEGSVVINNENLLGYFDYGAKYRIVVTVSDNLGQKTSVVKPFEVRWTHKAIMPTGTAEIEGMISKITPTAPTGSETGDYCDIYRLSVDKPVLIYPNAEFGETYVDPYPTIGEHGGHRIVFRTKNGDYVTDDNTFAWLDIKDILSTNKSIIDFEGGRVTLGYNVELTSAWKKDFQKTKYLGGSIQGDWDAGVERTSTVKAVGLTYRDPEMIQLMRRLAEHTGICHVRTVDGSSYSADVQVSETSGYSTAGKIASFDVSITRIDPEDYDGMPLGLWEE